MGRNVSQFHASPSCRCKCFRRGLLISMHANSVQHVSVRVSKGIPLVSVRAAAASHSPQLHGAEVCAASAHVASTQPELELSSASQANTERGWVAATQTAVGASQRVARGDSCVSCWYLDHTHAPQQSFAITPSAVAGS